ncbi:MAG: M23 family metallopeptidase [Elusimicrobia bacterium]|nr:M23 family metallopeptidase [Elusimicrobiota bacterium]
MEKFHKIAYEQRLKEFFDQRLAKLEELAEAVRQDNDTGGRNRELIDELKRLGMTNDDINRIIGYYNDQANRIAPPSQDISGLTAYYSRRLEIRRTVLGILERTARDQQTIAGRRIQELVDWKRRQMQAQGRQSQFNAQRWQEYFQHETQEGMISQHLDAMTRYNQAQANSQAIITQASAIREQSNPLNQEYPAYEDNRASQERIQANWREMRQVDYHHVVGVEPENITFSNAVASSHGELQLNEDGQPQRRRVNDERRQEMLEDVRSISDDMAAQGALTSVPQELRGFATDRAARQAGCSNRSRCLRIHEGFDLYNDYGTRVRSPLDGTVVIAGDAGDPENQVLINHGELSSRDDHAWVLSGLDHNGFRNRDGTNAQGTGVLARAGDELIARETVALMGDTGGSDVRYKPHVHEEFYVVPDPAALTAGTPEYNEAAEIRRQLVLLEELGRKYNGQAPPKSSDEQSDYGRWKSARTYLRDHLIDNRIPIGQVTDADGKVKTVYVREYGAYYQNYLREELNPQIQTDIRRLEADRASRQQSQQTSRPNRPRRN